MELRIAVQGDDLDEERLHSSTMELKRTIADETDASVSVPTTTAAAGSKGDPVTLGALAVTFLTSGAAVSLFKVLEAYVTRKRSINVELSRPDGQKFVLQATDMSPEEIAATQKAFESFIK